MLDWDSDQIISALAQISSSRRNSAHSCLDRASLCCRARGTEALSGDVWILSWGGVRVGRYGWLMILRRASTIRNRWLASRMISIASAGSLRSTSLCECGFLYDTRYAHEIIAKPGFISD